MDAYHAERHCALYFEALGPTEEQIFFHADQVCGQVNSSVIVLSFPD